MINKDIVFARIRRSGLRDLAGEFFVLGSQVTNLSGVIVPESLDALFGLYKSPDCWTIVSMDGVYFCTDGHPKYIQNNVFGLELHNFYFEQGKEYDGEFANIGKSGKVWIINTVVASAVANILLMFA